MGLRDWIRGAHGTARGNGQREPAPPPELVGRSPGENSRFDIEIDFEITGPSVSGAIELAGTTTFGADAVEALTVRKALTANGFLEGSAVLQREPENPVDPNAVAVLFEGERIGYVPSYATNLISLSKDGSLVVPLQLFTTRDEQRRWTRAWAWLDQAPPSWEYSDASPPPLSSAAKRRESARQNSEAIRRKLEEGGAAAAEVAAGMVNGVHYSEMFEPIQELKRQGRLEEALELCYRAIKGAEGDLYMGIPARLPTQEAAIVHRKLKQRDQEIAVLKRWLAYLPDDRRSASDLGQRLAKLEAAASPSG